MFCTHCGNKLDEGIQFCANCGAKITNGVSIQATQREIPPVAEPVKPAVQAPVPQTNVLPADKKLSVLALVAIILRTLAALINFAYYTVQQSYYNPMVSIMIDVMRLAGWILGTIAFVKLIKIIGNAIGYTIIVLLALLVLNEVFYLFRTLMVW